MMILFLKYYYDLRSEPHYSPLEMLQKLKEESAATEGDIKMEVVINGRHFKFSNSEFIKALLCSIDERDLGKHVFSDTFDQGGMRDKTRALDYYLIKTLLDYLPTKVEERKGKFSQTERNFALSVLNYCGRLVGDDIEGLCSFENNATFDKLMRDFKNTPIPFAMELFL